MAQLFVPLHGAFRTVTGSGFNIYGEDLERPLWRGAEIGMCDIFPDVLGAVSEAEFHDWIIGVHHPLYKEGGPAWCRFLDRDPAVRQAALDLAFTSAQAAHHLGARYILFHFPWPALVTDRQAHRADGWYLEYPVEEAAAWSEEALYDWSRRCFERFAEIQAKELIKVVLEIDGPNPFFYEGEMFSRLFQEFPDLSLCIDTGRLGLLARTHGQDPVALARRWLPWARHLHLSTSMWDAEGRYSNHHPTDATHTAERWPQVTPAAEIARMVVAAQPRCTIVLEHNPKKATPEQLEAAHAFAASLVEGR
ncbi:MAG: sugar phosphate isomerase/epimerase family protein [Bacillota bacterium]